MTECILLQWKCKFSHFWFQLPFRGSQTQCSSFWHWHVVLLLMQLSISVSNRCNAAIKTVLEQCVLQRACPWIISSWQLAEWASFQMVPYSFAKGFHRWATRRTLMSHYADLYLLSLFFMCTTCATTFTHVFTSEPELFRWHVVRETTGLHKLDIIHCMSHSDFISPSFLLIPINLSIYVFNWVKLYATEKKFRHASNPAYIAKLCKTRKLPQHMRLIRK